MSVLIAFATLEGQTGKIARHVEDRVSKTSREARLFDTGDRTSEVSFDDVDTVILAAPVHERRHPKPFEVFLSANEAELNSRRTLLLSVSLSAAFEDGRSEAKEYAEEMLMRTGLEPDKMACVAGAIKMGKYDYYAMQVVRHVILRGKDFDPSKNEHEFTDWAKLDALLSEFLDEKSFGSDGNGPGLGSPISFKRGHNARF